MSVRVRRGGETTRAAPGAKSDVRTLARDWAVRGGGASPRGCSAPSRPQLTLCPRRGRASRNGPGGAQGAPHREVPGWGTREMSRPAAGHRALLEPALGMPPSVRGPWLLPWTEAGVGGRSTSPREIHTLCPCPGQTWRDQTVRKKSTHPSTGRPAPSSSRGPLAPSADKAQRNCSFHLFLLRSPLG